MSLDLTVNEASLEDYEAMKMKQAYKFLVFVIKNDSEIEIESKAPPETPHSSLIKYLPEKEPRYILVDFTFKSNEVPPRDIRKMVAIRWCPSGVPVKQKFLYAGASQKFHAKLSGIHKATEAFNNEDLEEKAIQDLFK